VVRVCVFVCAEGGECGVCGCGLWSGVCVDVGVKGVSVCACVCVCVRVCVCVGVCRAEDTMSKRVRKEGREREEREGGRQAAEHKQ
jgi:hypothetical protein